MENLLKIISNEYELSSFQENQYINYINFLLNENTKFNLTNIKTQEDCFYFHILDSITIKKTNFLNNKKNISDIGSGCGVPGIPLAILYPEKQFYLIEVTQKKINFLKNTINLLGLHNCNVINYDFLTFIRKKNIQIDTFITRAALGLKEIILMYEIDFYKKTEIIYWGSDKWNKDPKHNIINNGRWFSK